MKLSWLTRRNQTALFAVTPAQGSDEGSVTVTAIVFPIWKSSGLPSVTHFSGTFRKNGATINPIRGNPTIAPQRPTSAIDSFSKNRRRLISSGVSVNGADDESLRLVFMANFRDPTGKRCKKENNTDEPNNPGGSQSPKNEGDSHGKPSWEIGWVRQWRIGEHLPARRYRVRMLGSCLVVRHLTVPVAEMSASARAGPELQLHKSHTWEPTSAVRRSADLDRSLGPSCRGSC